MSTHQDLFRSWTEVWTTLTVPLPEPRTLTAGAHEGDTIYGPCEIDSCLRPRRFIATSPPFHGIVTSVIELDGQISRRHETNSGQSVRLLSSECRFSVLFGALKSSA